jgi:TRAP-type C4-dicarboxylate transport system permease small subunit
VGGCAYQLDQSGKAMKRFDSFLVSVNRQVVIWMMALMAVMVFSNVIWRYVLSDSILWAEEISRYLMIWSTFLASGLLVRQGAHIAVDNLQDVVPNAVGKVIRFIIVATLLFFFVSMIYIGALYVVFQWNQVTPVTRIRFGFVYAALPVGFILMVYHTMVISWTWIKERKFEIGDDIKLFVD